MQSITEDVILDIWELSFHCLRWHNSYTVIWSWSWSRDKPETLLTAIYIQKQPKNYLQNVKSKHTRKPPRFQVLLSAFLQCLKALNETRFPSAPNTMHMLVSSQPPNTSNLNHRQDARSIKVLQNPPQSKVLTKMENPIHIIHQKLIKACRRQHIPNPTVLYGNCGGTVSYINPSFNWVYSRQSTRGDLHHYPPWKTAGESIPQRRMRTCRKCTTAFIVLEHPAQVNVFQVSGTHGKAFGEPMLHTYKKRLVASLFQVCFNSS